MHDKKMLTLIRGVAFVAGFSSCAHVANAASGISDLGVLSGVGPSSANGVSSDGSIIAGFSYNGATGGFSAFRGGASGGLASLGELNGGGLSYANGVSADGSVIVGSANDGAAGGAFRAFRWTQTNGMISLGTLNGGAFSEAWATSADGSVIVGYSIDGRVGNARAFRWTQAGGMVSLGALHGGADSQARGVSADGSVVVGTAADGAALNRTSAFRWTPAGGMVGLGWLNGGNASGAMGVSADGNVVVGQAADGAASNGIRAFRWTQAGGMVSLGVLNGGFYSAANATSADGNVVVGVAYDGAVGNAPRAFRWAQATGLQSVEQWLSLNGVTIGAGLATSIAQATNSDGSVVVGQLANGHAFFARIPPAAVASNVGVGLIDTVVYSQTLRGASYLSAQSIAQSDLVLHGLHGSPMRGLPKAGEVLVWVGGDWGRQENLTGDGNVGVGEIGVGYGFGNRVQLKVAIGHMQGDQSLAYNGKASMRGTFVVPELIAALPKTPLRASVAGYFSIGDANIQRGYENAGIAVKSSGSPAVETTGLRLRLDWIDAVRKGDFGMTPYASLTHYRTRIDSYTEHGGGFPVQWSERNEHNSLARLGADTTYAVRHGWTLLGRLEAVHRFDIRSSGATGTMLGLNSPFAFEGFEYKRDWLRAAVGVEGRIGSGIASLMLNASTETNGASYWAYANYRLAL